MKLLRRAAVQVAIIAGISGLVVFLVFPRFGVGAFFHGSLRQNQTSGFSDEVQLGGFGTIKDDTTVVMRLVPVANVPPLKRLTWHLRGSAFDRYAGGRWSHSAEIRQDPTRRKPMMPLPRTGGYKAFQHNGATVLRKPAPGTIRLRARPVPGFEQSERVARMQVTLEDIGTELLFAASEPLGVSLRPRSPIEARNRVYGDIEGQIRVPRRAPGPIRYEFASRTVSPSHDELQAMGNPVVPPSLAPYVDRAPLSSEVHDLAVEITRGATTRLDKVNAVMSYLGGFEYTLDLEPSTRVIAGADPLEGFLFDTQAGHCEYFATAMAVLLREVDVPTRNVNGYYGAHWNGVGQFYTVRQADAHSWVEVHFGPLGWITFDPTPPDGRTAGDDAEFFPGLSKLLDAARNYWLENVIGFDLGDQLDFLENVGVERRGTRLKIDWSRFGLWAASPFVLGFLLVALRRWNRRRRIRADIRLYLELLRELKRRGHDRGPDEGPLRFARRLREAGVPGAEAFVRFAQLYERTRFGPSAPDRPTLDHLHRQAGQVREGLRER